ncbi:hypothetical protein [Lactococcus fujiensis]|uniref:hypothetical protein n=1 Tax=Lactococcus fujiensis TaxID=610251 RepID=UPI0006D27E29|nr:hypothetical protein [Lactococcus fujiensis]
MIAYYFKNEIKELDENTSPFTVEERLKLEKLFTIIDFNVQQDHNHRPFNFIYDLPIFEKKPSTKKETHSSYNLYPSGYQHLMVMI